MYEIVDVGDTHKADSEWCDSAFQFNYSVQSDDKQVITFRQGFERQDEAYGRCVFVFAARWARRVENAIERGEALSKKLFDRTLAETDNTAGMGISAAQHALIVSNLLNTWKYGTELIRWHS